MTDSGLMTPQQVATGQERLRAVREGLGRVILGQDDLLDHVCIGLAARGHMLLEGLPGLGKTELVRTLGALLGLTFGRVQFTPDLLPSDITGGPILQEEGGRRELVFQQGPLFANLVLADEINRASPKTQSALLEAMQERHVTVFGTSHPLPDPFFVLATQNPIELEGTYPLPEAQLDRFLFKVDVLGVGADVLQNIITTRRRGTPPPVEQVLDTEGLHELFHAIEHVFLPEPVARYIARIVEATHPANGCRRHRLVRALRRFAPRCHCHWRGLPRVRVDGGTTQRGLCRCRARRACRHRTSTRARPRRAHRGCDAGRCRLQAACGRRPRRSTAAPGRFVTGRPATLFAVILVGLFASLGSAVPARAE